MNLDDLDLFKQIDTKNMLGFIDALPDQLANAWAHGQTMPLPEIPAVERVVICGMGGSAISGDLLAALAAETCAVPITVVRHYNLPAYASGEQTLVIALSHSGNTEETISATGQALERGATVLAITNGGRLSGLVQDGGGTVWEYDYQAPPRASLGWLYGMLLTAASRLGLVPDLGADIEEAVALLRRYREQWTVTSPVARNGAKRYAGQLYDRIPVMWASGLLVPVARRWKTQFNENSKSAAFYDELPELNHNTVVGIVAPDELLERHRFQVAQLRSADEHPRVAARHEITREMLIGQALLTDEFTARGESRLARQMNLIQLGDYTSYYLAMAYQVDPTPVGPIDMLKERLAQI